MVLSVKFWERAIEMQTRKEKVNKKEKAREAPALLGS